jgi:hypothetical protein
MLWWRHDSLLKWQKLDFTVHRFCLTSTGKESADLAFWMIWGSVASKARNSSHLWNMHCGCVVHLALYCGCVVHLALYYSCVVHLVLYSVSNGGSFPRGKVAEPWDWPLNLRVVLKLRMTTAVPLLPVFVLHPDNFTSTLPLFYALVAFIEQYNS